LILKNGLFELYFIVILGGGGVGMFWTGVWFVVNMFFVASVIVYLFMRRAYAMAEQQGADAARMKVLKVRCKWTGISAILLFGGMAASFVTNMAVNG